MSRINIPREQWIDILRRSNKIVEVGASEVENYYRISKVYFRNPDNGLIQIGVVMTKWIEDAKYLVREQEIKELAEELDPDY